MVIISDGGGEKRGTVTRNIPSVTLTISTLAEK
jgi:hypothetical protein